ncbi:RNA polymerase sigma factor [Chryseosolibacter indicus]|uniref:Sigma-70 family RNA polymerase sigma factor n=1 Tax=Chryseosolibacter indicus TaxID=2782351 RepID=A0ABS5VWQ5_9BACT|nr:sigma-70 family RNA polymerase sigma factor [Chryseosolibacter indicus]MBT1705169.1 sigma-70 family RNA polymerase sigma factor [Chryseosolibacter indicus]
MRESLSHDFEEQKHWDAMREGSVASLEWLYNNYAKLLYNYGRKIGTETPELEDAIHDLFVDLWKSRENISSTTSVRFYLYSSLRRRILRNSRGNDLFESRIEGIENALTSADPSAEQTLIDIEARNTQVLRLKKFLNDLSPRQYEALVLKFYDELSYEEIAAILNVNTQSARNLVQRGLEHLRHYLKLTISILFFFFLI